MINNDNCLFESHNHAIAKTTAFLFQIMRSLRKVFIGLEHLVMPLIYEPENHKRKHWSSNRGKIILGIKIFTNVNIDMHHLKDVES